MDRVTLEMSNVKTQLKPSPVLSLTAPPSTRLWVLGQLSTNPD